MGQENALIKLLTERQDKHKRERSVKQAEFERLATEIAELDERIGAIDVVITKELIDNALDARQVNEHARPPSEIVNGHQAQITQYTLYGNGNNKEEKDITEPLEPMGLKETARRYFDELPTLYSKKDVATLLLKKQPNRANINSNTLSGVMRDLVEKNLARVKRAASGKAKQIYEKI